MGKSSKKNVKKVKAEVRLAPFPPRFYVRLNDFSLSITRQEPKKVEKVEKTKGKKAAKAEKGK
jgi:hypothetical protein